jgi:hypothetical protein
MSAILIKGVIRNGKVEVDDPIDLPEGTQVIVTAAAGEPDDSGPMTSDEIARVLAAMEKVEPFDMTPQEEAAIKAWRKEIKEYTIANMHKGIEDLFQ